MHYAQFDLDMHYLTLWDKWATRFIKAESNSNIKEKIIKLKHDPKAMIYGGGKDFMY